MWAIMVYWVRYLCNCVRGKWRKPSYLNSASYTYSLLRYIHISRADQLSLEERRNALNLQATKEEKKKTKKDKERDKDRKKKKSKKKPHSAGSSRQDIFSVCRCDIRIYHNNFDC